MSPFVAYHATVRRYRGSIRALGLLAGYPNKQRPFGVYVFRGDYNHGTYGRFPFAVRWSPGNSRYSDLWQISYIGPILLDEYVENGLILPNVIPPQHLSLITHITPDIYA